MNGESVYLPHYQILVSYMLAFIVRVKMEIMESAYKMDLSENQNVFHRVRL